MVALAHDGPAAYRDQFELVFRREAAAANAIWQADHTQLDVIILDPAGRHARPWLTVILDDFSRAITGYAVNLGAPSALQTALVLRQAIWRKSDPAWTVCGLLEVLYSDHGSDFKSRHLEQVAADLRIQLINSTAGVPQGRGKIERLFGTITTELLPQLPGYLPPPGAGPSSAPRLSLAELDAAPYRALERRPQSRLGLRAGALTSPISSTLARACRVEGVIGSQAVRRYPARARCLCELRRVPRAAAARCRGW